MIFQNNNKFLKILTTFTFTLIAKFEFLLINVFTIKSLFKFAFD